MKTRQKTTRRVLGDAESRGFKLPLDKHGRDIANLPLSEKPPARKLTKENRTRIAQGWANRQREIREMKPVSLEDLGISTKEIDARKKTERLDGKVFELPLFDNGKVDWESVPPEVKAAYAIAFCREHRVTRSKLPRGLIKNILDGHIYIIDATLKPEPDRLPE